MMTLGSFWFALCHISLQVKLLNVEDIKYGGFMQSRKRQLIQLLCALSALLQNIGDVIFAVFVIQLITQFEPHQSYPFLGIRGYLSILLIYLLSLACHISAEQLEKSK